MLKNHFSKAKTSLFKLAKYFIELKVTELKDRLKKKKEIKIKKQIEKLFSKEIIVFIDDIDRFEKEEMKKVRPIKNICHDWLINHIPKSIRKSLVVFKDKIVSLFKTNTPKQSVYGRGKKLSKPRNQNIKKPFILKEYKKKIRNKTIRNIQILFETEEEKEERKKQKHNERLIKDKKIRDIRSPSEQQQEEYYKSKTVSNF